MKLTKNLYKIVSLAEQKAVIVLCDKSHMVFKAHFPTKPILPGFMHFDIVEELFKIKIIEVKKAKFLKVVTPQQTLTYEHNKNNFKVICKDEVVASFRI